MRCRKAISVISFSKEKIALGLEPVQSEIKVLIFSLVHTDPAKRISAGETLANRVFAGSEIGSDKARKIIISVGEANSGQATWANRECVMARGRAIDRGKRLLV